MAGSSPRQEFNRNGWAYGLLFPSLLLLFLTLLLPAVATLWMSFTNISFIRPTQPVGLMNYVRLLGDVHFHQALQNTFIYMAGVTLPTMALGLVAAIAVNRRFPLRVAFRTIFYLPVLMSLISAAVVWLYLYEPYVGPINGALVALGFQPQPWLQVPDNAMLAMIIMAIWRDFGTAMIIYLAGLQDIPRDVYEAARLDGANGVTIFFRITVPMLATVTFYLLIVLIVQTFQVFGAIYVMTEGGPLGSTDTVVYQMYRTAFAFTDFGYASAMSTVLFAVILLVSISGTWALRRART